MAAPTRRRFINVYLLTHGVQEVNTVQSVSFSENAQRVVASGDNDKYATFHARGMADVNGSLVIQDPIQAESLKAKAPATMTFKGEPETGGVALTVTILNVEFFGQAPTFGHQAVSGITLPWAARSADGIASPVSMAAA